VFVCVCVCVCVWGAGKNDRKLKFGINAVFRISNYWLPKLVVDI
jgi:hypothetical protein